VDETYPDLPSPEFRDIGQPSSDTNSSSNTLSTAPLDAASDEVNIVDFWAAAHESDTVFDQADNGAQWAAYPYEERVEPSGSTLNTAVAEDVTLNYDPDWNNYALTHNLETNHLVSAYDVPPVDVACRLIDRYTRTVHDWIPIVPAAFLNREVGKYYNARVPVSNTWLITLHLVFAIAARHGCLTDRSAARERDDVQHFSRAIQLLGISEAAVVTATPDVGLVQVSWWLLRGERRADAGSAMACSPCTISRYIRWTSEFPNFTQYHQPH
jgi:hypothetical protein